MIDGFKILNLCVNIPELLENKFLCFPLPVNEKDGEIMDNARLAEFYGLRFILKNDNVKLNGSFHKYFNGGLHNYNDFRYSDIVRTINEITSRFQIDSERTLLNNLEFGVNICIGVDVATVLKSLIHYRGNAFHPFTITGANGKECATDNFYIKIYDKSHQYNRPGNILRFEVKVVKMKFFADRKIKINTLLSLTDINEISKLTDVLTSIFNNILFTDHNIRLNDLTAKERLIFANGNNPNYWEQLKPISVDYTGGNTDKQYISERKRYYRELKKFNGLVSKHSTSTLKNDISNLIGAKGNELMKPGSEIVDKFPDFETATGNPESGQIHILSIVGDCPQLGVDSITRRCLTCQVDISHKKRGAKFCSKKCKNDFTNPKLNPKNNLLRKLQKYNSGLWLFDMPENIVLNEYRIELLSKPNTISAV